MIDDYIIDVRCAALTTPAFYRVAVYFGLIVGWSSSLRDLVGVCAHNFAEFAALCADLGWVLSNGSEVN